MRMCIFDLVQCNITRVSSCCAVAGLRLLQEYQRTHMRLGFLKGSFQRSCFKSLLTPAQAANLLVHSYPCMPDMEQVLRVLQK